MTNKLFLGSSKVLDVSFKVWYNAKDHRQNLNDFNYLQAYLIQMREL